MREAIAMEILIRKSRVLCLRAAPSGLSQLGTSFVGTRAELSTKWHSSHVVVIDYHCYPGTGPVDAWIARTHGLIHMPGVAGACIDPSHPRSHGVVHRFGRTRSYHRDPLKGRGSDRVDAWTHWDSNPGHPPCKGGTLPLSYGPAFHEGRHDGCQP